MSAVVVRAGAGASAVRVGASPARAISARAFFKRFSAVRRVVCVPAAAAVRGVRSTGSRREAAGERWRRISGRRARGAGRS